jgi:3-oxoacyl-[acyl-carrier protein] reductase
MKLVDGKVAIVTGASRGIGVGIAEVLGENGAAVIVNYLKTEDGAMKVAQHIESCGGRALPFRADVRDRDQVQAMVNAAVEKFGKVDVLVNNAYGGALLRPFMDYQWSDFVSQYESILKQQLNTIQCVVPVMEKNGGGSIVNILSTNVHDFDYSLNDYRCAKMAALGLTMSLAWEFGPKRIRVNAVSPGLVMTELVKEAPKEHIDAMIHETPLGRLVEPREVGKAVLFYSSDLSCMVTGSNMPVCGGHTLFP